MTACPLVSIVTPSWNQSRFIQDTIVSVQTQDYPNIEHIIIDGGSTDGTVRILEECATKYNLAFVSETDKGQSHAINKGFRRAKGQIFAWLNSDDLYLPATVSRVVETFAQTGTDIVYGDLEYIDADGQLLRHGHSIAWDPRAQLYGPCIIGQPACFFASHAFWTVGGLDESFQHAMDSDLWIRLGQSGFGFYYLRRPLAAFRLHAASKTISQRKDQVNEAYMVRVKNAPHTTAWQRCLRHRYYWLKRHYLLLRDHSALRG